MTTYQAYNTRANLFVGWFGAYESRAELEKNLKDWNAPEYIICKELDQ